MSVVEHVRSGNVPALARELAPLTAAERRELLPGLKQLRKELRDSWSSRAGAWSCLMVAGAVCHSAPSGAAAWLGGREFEDISAWRHARLRELLDDRPAEWQAAVAERLAERRPNRWGTDERLHLVEYLVHRSGCPVPTSDGFVLHWARDRGRPGPRPEVPRPLPVGTDLYVRLLADPWTPVLAPRLFEVAEAAEQLAGPWAARDDGRKWPAVLAELAEAGVLDRADLIDRCLARLLRGGRANELRVFQTVLKALAPTAAENTARVRTYLALLDGPSPIAGEAQQVLIGLDATDLLAEASQTVLFRTEKKLVRAQLGWLDRTARAGARAGDGGERAGEVVLAAAAALGHPDRALQEAALKVIARHLSAAGEAVLPELRLAAEALDPAHHARAADLFGAAPAAAEEYREQLPVVAPRPVPAPPASPEETAEELAAVLAGDDGLVPFERTLDALVRHSFQNREALARALEPVLRVGARTELYTVGEAVCGRIPAHQAWAAVQGRQNWFRHHWTTSFDHQRAARLEEAVWRIVVRPVPFLLAIPTDATGAIDPAALVDRLTRYEEAGLGPGPADLAQALLRVAPTTDPAVLAAAGRLESPEGERLAHWLRTGGLPRQTSEPVTADRRDWRGGRIRTMRQPGVVADPALPADAACLVGPPEKLRLRDSWWSPQPAEHWLGTLPGHREELAARLLRCFAEVEERGAQQVLPQLAEAAGPAGPAVHLAVGYGLAARHVDDRTAAVDALLVLAARGDLDATLLGAELGELVRGGLAKTTRIAAALRSAADTGAYRTVWGVLAVLLPVALTDRAPDGAAELVALAVDCVRRCGARGPVAEVTAAAGRGGSSRLVQEARALDHLLAGR
ncbi:DUF6493 family protein [Kitasatospora cinereorecta]|uniref:DUF6493 family protein n=1 Tax=Kitasatospora cinereorecta TaxID=285560 RepID=A0ABW0VBM8_9ACTN